MRPCNTCLSLTYGKYACYCLSLTLYFIKTIKMKNHNLIQSLPKVKQKIHVIYCGEIGKDGYESKKRSMNSLSLRIVKTDSRKYNSLLCETYKTEIKVNIQ